jgi:hypothetical protein
MGYSTPKKQLDLKDFLSQPAKKPVRRTFGNRSRPIQADKPDSTNDTPAEQTPAE